MNYPSFSAEIDKRKVLIAALLLLALSIGCAYYLYRGPNPDSMKVFLRDPRLFYPAMGVGALLFLGLGVLGLSKLRGASALKAGPDGIDLNGALKIAWRDIAGVEAYTDLTSAALHGYKILLTDPDGFLDAHRDHRLHKRMLSTYATVRTPVLVYTNSLRFDDRKFLEVVNHYLGAASRR